MGNCTKCGMRPRYMDGIYCRECRQYVVMETYGDVVERRVRGQLPDRLRIQPAP